ncbi:MAG: molybdate ABC transporter substrate-binding protein, partial [Bacteroidota bacterium]
MSVRWPWYGLGLLAFLLTGLSCNRRLAGGKPELILAVASSLRLPCEHILQAFEAECGLTVGLVSASSGVLTAQIKQGAPFDIFLSANEAYPAALYAAGLSSEPATVFTYGQLYFWSKAALEPEALISGNLLPNSPEFKVAIASPELAPYGMVAKSWFQQQGIWEMASNRLIYAENVGQVNQYIFAGAVQAAFSCNSAASAPPLSTWGCWYPVPNSPRLPHYGLIIGSPKPAAQLLFNYLQDST